MTRDYRWLLIGAEYAREPHVEAPSPATEADAEEFRLFVRGDESIRLAIRADAQILRVFGPGRVQKVHEFTSAHDLERFVESYQQRMIDAGWRLHEVGDRRLASRS